MAALATPASAQSQMRNSIRPQAAAMLRSSIPRAAARQAIVPGTSSKPAGSWRNDGGFPVASRRDCVGEIESGGPPSYVELLTCLEMFDEAAKERRSPGARRR